jgi:hypothetical protein
MMGTFTFVDHIFGEQGYSSSEGNKSVERERLRKTNEEMTATVLNVFTKIGQLQ